MATEMEMAKADAERCKKYFKDQEREARRWELYKLYLTVILNKEKLDAPYMAVDLADEALAVYYNDKEKRDE
jgi:hypothetical protein